MNSLACRDIISGCRSKLQAKERALAEAKDDLLERADKVKSVTERFDGPLEKLADEERQLAEQQIKRKEEEKLQEEMEAGNLASISAAEQSVNKLDEKVQSHIV